MLPLLLRNRSRPFSPRSIPGLTIWLDAAFEVYKSGDLTLPAVAEGDLVQSWGDLSGNNNYVRQLIPGRIPAYTPATGSGFPGVKFDGSAYMSLDVVGGLTLPVFTCFILYQDYAGAVGGLFGNSNGANTPWQRPAELIVSAAYWDSTIVPPGGRTLTNTNLLTMVYDYAGRYHNWRMDGFDVGTITPAAPVTQPNGAWGFGNTFNDILVGSFCSMVVYNRRLSLGEITRVEDWLYQRCFLNPQTGMPLPDLSGAWLFADSSKIGW